jgi:hypothetical protein
MKAPISFFRHTTMPVKTTSQSQRYHHVIRESFVPITTPSYYTLPSSAKTHPTEPPARFVETLRARGLKVRVKHFRWVLNTAAFLRGSPSERLELLRISKHERKKSTEVPPPLIFQNGGETHVTVITPDGRESVGVAECSLKDPYNKRLGVYIAAKRALAGLKLKDRADLQSAG